MEVKEVTITRVQFTEPDGKVQVFTETDALKQHYKTKIQSEHNVMSHYAEEILRHGDESIRLHNIQHYINGEKNPISDEEGQGTQHLTLDKLILGLIELRKTTPGNYHVTSCTEHEKVGGQLEEAISGFVGSHREGKVILLTESFK